MVISLINNNLNALVLYSTQILGQHKCPVINSEDTVSYVWKCQGFIRTSF